ncbi:MAG: hypothetical protein LC750_18430 [Actinobacteria bacterium]|nr:hypothetical protein [Actinomycetota bacterium]
MLVRLKIVLAVVIGALVVTAGSLAAAKPAPYNGNAGNVEQQVNGAAGSNTLGALPFTGLDLALIVGGGLLLVLAGVSLRRMAARRTTV